MICDADSHFTPIEIIDRMDDDLGCRMRSYCSMDLALIDREWQKYYAIIKDPAWPECDRVADIVDLPDPIKQELRVDFNRDGLWISKDLQDTHFDPAANEWPDLDTHEKTAKLILGVDRQIINPNVSSVMFQPLSYQIDPIEVQDYTKIWNDACLEITENRSCFDCNMWLPLQNLDFSMQEFERLKNKKFFGVRLSDDYPYGFVEQFDDLWQSCAKNHVPIYLHITGLFEPIPRSWRWNYLDTKYQAMAKQWLGHVYTVGGLNHLVTLASFITQGVLDRYPGLRIVVAEKSLCHLVQLRNFMLDQEWPDPLPYLQNNFWWTVDPEEENFVELARFVGFDRLLFATDYPHNDPGGLNRYNDVRDVRTMLAEKIISQDEFDLLTHRNYMKLLDRT